MVTSKSSRDQVIACIQAGCDDYIVKPCSMDVILQKLKKLGLVGEDFDADLMAPEKITGTAGSHHQQHDVLPELKDSE